jgi:hypothetical protein
LRGGPDTRIWAGQVSLANGKNKLEYATVHMNQLRQNRRTPRFGEALQVVSARD